jgi:hypothetical protein
LRIIANDHLVTVIVGHLVVATLFGAFCCQLDAVAHSFCLGNTKTSGFKDLFLLEACINTANIVINKSLDITHNKIIRNTMGCSARVKLKSNVCIVGALQTLGRTLEDARPARYKVGSLDPGYSIASLYQC